MPQTIYLPRQQNWWDPMFKQGSNFLWQLAMSKAQHKMKMEESDRLLAAKKIESEEERAFKTGERKEGEKAKAALQEDAQAHQIELEEKKAGLKPKKKDVRAYLYPDGKVYNINVNEVTPPVGAVPIKYHPEYGATKTKPKDTRTAEIKLWDRYKKEYIDRYGKSKFQMDFPGGISDWLPKYYEMKRNANMWTILGGMMGEGQGMGGGTPQGQSGGFQGPGVYKIDGQEVEIRTQDEYLRHMR
jgi:hypothetical protein